MTHDCQSKCYGTESFTKKEADKCSYDCLKPFETFKKMTQPMLDNCEVI